MRTLLENLAHVDGEILQQVLKVLNVGVEEFRGEVAQYTDILEPSLAPPQYLELLSSTLGLHDITGLSVPDTRALIATLGAAYYHKGNIHGLRTVARAIWRYSEIFESYEPIYANAVNDPSGPTALAEWQTWLNNNNIDPDKLLEVVIRTQLEVDDAREYGLMQALEYQSLLDAVRKDSGYEKLLRTYRPGFDMRMSTLLGVSQIDPGVGLREESFLLYGANVAFIDGSSQAIIEALKWNTYPAFKQDVSYSTLKHFIPILAKLLYEYTGFRQDDTFSTMAYDEVTLYFGPPI